VWKALPGRRTRVDWGTVGKVPDLGRNVEDCMLLVNIREVDIWKFKGHLHHAFGKKITCNKKRVFFFKYHLSFFWTHETPVVSWRCQQNTNVKEHFLLSASKFCIFKYI